MKPAFPDQAHNLKTVADARNLAEYQGKWLVAGKRQGYLPLPPDMYIQVATVAQIVCDCGERFIWPHHARNHYDGVHKPKPTRLHLAGQRLKWAWHFRSLKPLYTAGP